MSRIKDTFTRLDTEARVGVAPYLTVGFPDRDSTIPLLGAMVDGGADIIELGVPFSDPLADGATIQRANQVALDNGVTLSDCLDVCDDARARFPDTPLLMMSYYNPILSYGIERFTQNSAQAGMDGLIVTDIPPEEAEQLSRACVTRGIDLVFLLAPTSSDERIRWVCDASRSLIYCVSLTGVTGAREELDPDLPRFLERVRRWTSLPLMVGFGISTRAHVEAIGHYAESVAVGSALIKLIDQCPPSECTRRVREYMGELAGSGILQA